MSFIARQPLAAERLHDIEGDRPDRDPDRHAGATDQRERGVLDQHPETQLEVQRQATDPREPAPFADLLLVALHPPERDHRPPPCFFRWEAGPQVLVDLHVEMELHLALEGPLPRERAQLSPPTAE